MHCIEVADLTTFLAVGDAFGSGTNSDGLRTVRPNPSGCSWSDDEIGDITLTNSPSLFAPEFASEPMIP